MSEYVLFALSTAVSAVVRVLGVFRPRPREPAGERILIVKLDHLGDILLATAAIRALREACPGATLHALIAPGSRAALEGNPCVDRILTYESARFRRGPRREGAAAASAARRAAWTTLRHLARNRYTTIVELRGDAWTLLLPFWTGARRRVDRGSVRARDWFSRRLGGARARARPPLHEVETNLAIVRPLLGRAQAAAPASHRIEIYPSPAARESVRRKLAALGADLSLPLVTIHPGASWRPRAWRPERFAAVAAWVREHYHAQIAFVGSEEERDIEAAVRAHLGTECDAGGFLWLAGKLSLEELGALLAESALFLGNDAGPAHLAAACGVPSVVLFGPQDPRRFRPWSERTIVLHHRERCWPCRQTVCVVPHDPCVNRIGVAEVREQVTRILGGNPRPCSRATVSSS